MMSKIIVRERYAVSLKVAYGQVDSDKWGGKIPLTCGDLRIECKLDSLVNVLRFDDTRLARTMKWIHIVNRDLKGWSEVIVENKVKIKKAYRRWFQAATLRTQQRYTARP